MKQKTEKVKQKTEKMKPKFEKMKNDKRRKLHLLRAKKEQKMKYLKR